MMAEQTGDPGRLPPGLTQLPGLPDLLNEPEQTQYEVARLLYYFRLAESDIVERAMSLATKPSSEPPTARQQQRLCEQKELYDQQYSQQAEAQMQRPPEQRPPDAGYGVRMVAIVKEDVGIEGFVGSVWSDPVLLDPEHSLYRFIKCVAPRQHREHPSAWLTRSTLRRRLGPAPAATASCAWPLSGSVSLDRHPRSRGRHSRPRSQPCSPTTPSPRSGLELGVLVQHLDGQQGRLCQQL
nr:hypothetical protein HK105_003425 [Polyrhizophydium stewartii]